MRPPSLHSNFFSTLKQVEKRLKSENPSQPPNLSSSSSSPVAETESLSSPIYLNYDQPKNSSSSTLQDSEPPAEFLSHSLGFPPIHEDPPQSNSLVYDQTVDEAEDDKDDIERLIQLLGLSECNVEEKEQKGGLDLNCDGEGGFHSKIVGVKGPKCMKEIERLNEWIQFFLNDGGGERIEPFRLVHLLLGKTAFLCEDSGDFEGFEFPPTIEEYLQNDPPTT